MSGFILKASNEICSSFLGDENRFSVRRNAKVFRWYEDVHDKLLYFKEKHGNIKFEIIGNGFKIRRDIIKRLPKNVNAMGYRINKCSCHNRRGQSVYGDSLEEEAFLLGAMLF